MPKSSRASTVHIAMAPLKHVVMRQMSLRLGDFRGLTAAAPLNCRHRRVPAVLHPPLSASGAAFATSRTSVTPPMSGTNW